MSAVLDVVGLRKTFDNIHVIRGIDLSAEQGERHAIIGPNGAGKSPDQCPAVGHGWHDPAAAADGTSRTGRRSRSSAWGSVAAFR